MIRLVNMRLTVSQRGQSAQWLFGTASGGFSSASCFRRSTRAPARPQRYLSRAQDGVAARRVHAAGCQRASPPAIRIVPRSGPYLGAMMHRSGTRGRITIERAVRDAPGVRPCDVAVQRLEDGLPGIRFVRLPEPHERSLAGVLGPLPQSPSDEPWDDAIAVAIVAVGPSVLAP